MSDRSSEYAERRFVWHPYTQMKDWQNQDNRLIVSGKGFYLRDSRGRQYLDGTSSMWCNVWGHGQNEVVQAMCNQLGQLQHSTLFGLGNKPSANLAKRLIGLAKGMNRVFYTDNGSTAIEAALKMALQYWQNVGKPEKKLFVSLEGGYHGDTVGAMSVGYVEQFFSAYKPLLTKVSRAPNPLLYKSKFDSEKELVDNCLEKTEKIFKKLGPKCAGFVMESGAQIAGGVVIYPKDYQKKISDLCKKYDILLILDEIATGFGRLGNMIEYLAQNSKPDIVCMGKALTAGYFPLAVTLATERMYKAFLGNYEKNKHFYHGHTFTGHPVGCAAALANLDLYEKRNLVRMIDRNAKYIKQRLCEFEEISIVADIRHRGMLAGIELAQGGKPLLYLRNKERINYFIMRESLEMGVHLRSLGNILVVIPPLAIGRDDLEKMMDTHLNLVKKAAKLS